MTAAPVGLIIFDCDGVLVDSEPLSMRILLQAIAEAGAEIDAAQGYEAFLGKSLASVCALLRRDYRVDMDDAALERMREHLYQAIRQELQPIAGIAEALDGLARPVCVASSSQPERIGLSLEVTGLAPFFNGHVFSASMVARGKPAPDLFLHAAREMQVAPSDCIVVEDSPAGIVAALKAGMGVFGFTGGSHARSQPHRQKLAALGPIQVFEDMRELPGLIRNLERGQRVS
ncbi:HAD family hydrolase [Pelagibius litoralis]|uniref:HAD family hydrolase n=1 Tax=Pelagibius litoralis TaxID=374515 RepID=A0A967C1Z5_9PROT|nr:HAD family hydrolase [Pelagibius litoralis]NIA68341.1 HAD family hydrolase [Pelagibius litoralis]